MIGQFWVALFPHSDADVNNFFQNYLTVPFTLLCYLGHKTWTRSWGKFYIKTEDIDIYTGRTIVDAEVLQLDREEKEQKLAAARWYSKPFVWFFN